MPDAGADLMRAARDRAAERAAETVHAPCAEPSHLAELFRRQTILDCAGLGPELAQLREAQKRTSGPPGSLRERAIAHFGRLLRPWLWRLLCAGGMPNPFEAVYEMLLRQLEWQLAAEKKMSDDLAAMRRRLEALEESRDGKGRLE